MSQTFVKGLAKDLAWTLRRMDDIVNLTVNEQSAFFRGSEDLSQLRPIGITEIATKVGLHRSTVSRLARQVTVIMNGKELPLCHLMPSSRLRGMKMREAVNQLTLDPEYSDGEHWLVGAEAIRSLLHDMTGMFLQRRMVSKYLSETGLQARHNRDLRKPSNEEVQQAWRVAYAGLRLPTISVSERAKQAAKNLEDKRLRRIKDKTAQLCSSLTDEAILLTEAYINLATKCVFVLVPAEKSLMLKTEPWTPTLLYFMPGKGLILAPQNILNARTAETNGTSLEAYASILGFTLALLEKNQFFVPSHQLTIEKLSQLLSLLQASLS
ncbi:MAG TPA: hypothetical protein VGT24_12765 [Candidatus Acidoferrales bacterium]|nr:hypothetical protein [Candidatus Acidoferrales bacterium]